MRAEFTDERKGEYSRWGVWETPRHLGLGVPIGKGSGLLLLQESRAESHRRRASGEQRVLVCDSLWLGVLMPASSQVCWKLLERVWDPIL